MVFKEAVQAIGNMIGRARDRNAQLVDEWRNWCTANGQKPYERMLQLIAFDLQNGGANLGLFFNSQQQNQPQNIEEVIDHNTKMVQLVERMTDAQIQRNTQFANQMSQMLDHITALKQQLAGMDGNVKIREEPNPESFAPAGFGETGGMGTAVSPAATDTAFQWSGTENFAERDRPARGRPRKSKK